MLFGELRPELDPAFQREVEMANRRNADVEKFDREGENADVGHVEGGGKQNSKKGTRTAGFEEFDD